MVTDPQLSGTFQCSITYCQSDETSKKQLSSPQIVTSGFTEQFAF